MYVIHDFQYLRSKSTEPYRKFLRDKQYSSNDLGESYRVINHWADLGLLDDSRSDSNKWRKFSLVDIVWVFIVKELRKYGFPLEKIKELRYNLFKIPFGTDWPEYDLEFHIFLTMIHQSVVMLVFEDGGGVLLCEPDKPLSEYLHQGKMNSHLLIDLNKIMGEVFPKKDFRPHFPKMAYLSDQEFELVNFIRFNTFDEVKVVMKDGRIDRFDGKKTKTLETDLLKLIEERQYQRIEVLVAGKKPIKVIQTVLQKPLEHGTPPAQIKTNN